MDSKGGIKKKVNRLDIVAQNRLIGLNHWRAVKSGLDSEIFEDINMYRISVVHKFSSSKTVP